MSTSEPGCLRGRLKIVGDVGSIVVNDASGRKNASGAAPQPKPASGYDEGYKKGWEERGAQAQAETAALRAQVDSIGRQLPEAISAYFKELEAQALNEVCEIAFATARIIIGREFDADPEAVRSVIVGALAPILNPQGVKLRLNPGVADIVATSGMEGVSASVTVVPDTSLGIGDVVVECQQGIIDGTVEGRFIALRELISKSLGNGQPAGDGQ